MNKAIERFSLISQFQLKSNGDLLQCTGQNKLLFIRCSIVFICRVVNEYDVVMFVFFPHKSDKNIRT